MPSFNDKQGDRWNVDLTLGAVKRVRDQLPGIDLLLPREPAGDEQKTDFQGRKIPLMTRLHIDLCLVAAVLYAICEPQARKLQISPEEFGERLDGEAALGAYAALMQGWADFFQKAGRPTDAKAIAANVTLVAEEDAKDLPLIEMAAISIQQQMASRRQQLSEAMQRGEASSSLPASSDSPKETSSS